MTEKEKLAIEHARHFAKNWDYFIIAVEAYLAGFNEYKINGHIYSNAQVDYGDLKVALELKEGEHQLSASTFERWRKENESNQS